MKYWLYSRCVGNDVAVCQLWRYCTNGQQLCAVTNENQTF